MTDKVAGFLTKTFEMVTHPACQEWISWSKNGESFVVTNKEMLSRDVLPRFFKHNNFSSFIRQLNMYGFRKIGDPQHWEFCHEYFKRGQPQNLRLIKRKAVSTTSRRHQNDEGSSSGVKRSASDAEDDQIVSMDEVLSLHNTLEIVENNLQALQHDNQALRQENSTIRAELFHLRTSLAQVETFLEGKFTGQFSAAPRPVRQSVPLDDRTQEPPRKKQKKGLTVDIPGSGRPFSGNLPSLGLTPRSPNSSTAALPLSPGFRTLLNAVEKMDERNAQSGLPSAIAVPTAIPLSTAITTSGKPEGFNYQTQFSITPMSALQMGQATSGPGFPANAVPPMSTFSPTAAGATAFPTTPTSALAANQASASGFQSVAPPPQISVRVPPAPAAETANREAASTGLTPHTAHAFAAV